MSNTSKLRKQLQFLFFLIVLVCIIFYFIRTSTKFTNKNNERHETHQKQHIPFYHEKPEEKEKPENPLYCYDILDDILEDITEVNVKKGKTIFFHETSCISNEKGKIVLTAREACAVESAAKYNPNFDVLLLFTSPGLIKINGEESDKIINALLEYKNIKFYHLNYDKYSTNTPVENLYKSGKIKSSQYAISHASDVLRYLTLWKYGGIYLDLDVIVKKNIEDLPQNFAGFQEPNYVGSSVLSFTHDGLGHFLIKACVDYLAENFNGSAWTANGPDVITWLHRNICSEKNGTIVPPDCFSFRVYESKMFYPIPYHQWMYYFDEKYLNKTLELTEDSYILHIWNKLSSDAKLSKNSSSAYILFAKKHCPKVFHISSEYM